MIVFDLKCADHAHVFEAWFASSQAFEDQRSRGFLICPICGDSQVSKALMAPAIPAKGNRQTLLPVASPTETDDAGKKAMLAALAKAQASALENSTWVGRQFDATARAMDAGETPKTSIHGEVSASEAKALIEDGIGVMPLLLPIIPPDQRN
jgi:hypothetical protein